MGKCSEKCEVYSRVCGYFRPVANWNKGKREEFNDRKTFKIPAAATPLLALAVTALTLCGCASTHSTVTEYDAAGNVTKITETSESVISSVVDSTRNKTVIAWEDGWAAYISVSSGTVDDPTPHGKIFAGQVNQGAISILPEQKNLTGIAQVIQSTKTDVAVKLSDNISATGSEPQITGNTVDE